MHFRKDAPQDFPLGRFKAGQRVKTRFCGFYKLRGGKICEFRVFPFLGEQLDCGVTQRPDTRVACDRAFSDTDRRHAIGALGVRRGMS